MTRDKWNNWRQAWHKKTADEIYFYDQTKLDILRNRGFVVLEIWEGEYNKNSDKILQECLDFISKYI